MRVPGRCEDKCPTCGRQCVLTDDHESQVDFTGAYVMHECAVDHGVELNERKED